MLMSTGGARSQNDQGSQREDNQAPQRRAWWAALFYPDIALRASVGIGMTAGLVVAIDVAPASPSAVDIILLIVMPFLGANVGRQALRLYRWMARSGEDH